MSEVNAILSQDDKLLLIHEAKLGHNENSLALELHHQLTDVQKESLNKSDQLRKDGAQLACSDNVKEAESKLQQALKTDEKAFGMWSSVAIDDCFMLGVFYGGLHQDQKKKVMFDHCNDYYRSKAWEAASWRDQDATEVRGVNTEGKVRDPWNAGTEARPALISIPRTLVPTKAKSINGNLWIVPDFSKIGEK